MGTVLVNVDDHEAGRYARSRLLEAAGYVVREAGTGMGGLALVQEVRPVLVLLDVNLPDVDGLEICRRIKSDPALANTLVLQVSASAVTPVHRVQGLENGADSYLVEPVDSQVLLATVRSLLRIRKAEEELQRANRALTQANAALSRSNDDLQRFSYMASHDLQEPLRTVSSFASLLVRRYRGKLDGEADEFLQHIQNGTERMSTLIQSLLAYAHAGSDGDSGRAAVDTESVFASTIRNLEQAIAESSAVVSCGMLPVVLGNSTQVGQLFQNLLSNSLKYCRSGVPPKVAVWAERSPDAMWTFSVKDNGIGIDAKHHEGIFAPFRRLHGREVPGTGIGLSACQRIVERHGGTIWVESDGKDCGATFSFTLPASIETPAARSERDSNDIASTSI